MTTKELEKVMRQIKLVCMGMLTTALGGIVIWNVLLNQQARDSIVSSARDIYATVEDLKEHIESRKGTYVDDGSANRAAVEREWHNIGYY